MIIQVSRKRINNYIFQNQRRVQKNSAPSSLNIFIYRTILIVYTCLNGLLVDLAAEDVGDEGAGGHDGGGDYEH